MTFFYSIVRERAAQPPAAHMPAAETSADASADGASKSPSLRVREAFFDEPDVQRTAELCVRSLADCTADPLSVFGNVAIRSAISCTFTPDGLLPFSADLRVVVPFVDMSAAQLRVVRAIACSMRALDTMRYKHPNGTLSISCPRDSGRVFADAALVLFALNTLIVRAVDGRGVHLSSVINVTQQRILATVHVHRSLLARADALTRAFVAARARDTAPSL